MAYIGKQPFGVLLPGSVTADKIADNAVTTNKIINDAVTTGKIAPDATIIEATEQVTTSGTEFNFESIPSGVKRITVMFENVSLSGADFIYIQLGDVTSYETTGYVGGISHRNGEADWGGSACEIWTTAAGDLVSGSVVITRMKGSTNKWSFSGNLDVQTTVGARLTNGTKSLTGELTRIKVTRSGTNTFDSGAINIIYEGK